MRRRRRAARGGLIVLTTAGLAVGVGHAATRPLKVPATAASGPKTPLYSTLTQTAYSAPVMVYPSPGDRYEQRQTQISFRGIPAADIGDITVVGSRSGVHTGQIEADSDGRGASFLPDHPFRAGERVTVTTDLKIIGGQNGSFHFSIDHPRPGIGYRALPRASAPNGIHHYYSVPGLVPATLEITQNSTPPSDGDFFVAPQYGPAENGPMILDPRGRLVWFRPFPLAERLLATDFRVQHLGTQPVLTWWQGNSNEGSGRGEGIILDDHYQQIATVKAGNGLQMDLHEFLVTPAGDAYIIAVAPTGLPHVRRSVENGVVQEIDIKTGLVLFQWDALDHIPLSDSVKYGKNTPGHILDPYHLNSISLDHSGNPVISSRNTNAVFDVSRSTGRTIWELGGRHSSFRIGAGAGTAFQHDAVVQPNGMLTIFDDGAGPPTVHAASRGIEVSLNTHDHTATLVHQWKHTPSLSSNFEGDVQRLPSGNTVLGWGQQPYFSEIGVDGRQIFDARFIAPSSSYRAYRFPWSGHPNTRPVTAVRGHTVYASWNGATGIHRWRVLAGSTATKLHSAGTRPWAGFETSLPIPSGAKQVAVQALDAKGAVMATSGPHAVSS